MRSPRRPTSSESSGPLAPFLDDLERDGHPVERLIGARAAPGRVRASGERWHGPESGGQWHPPRHVPLRSGPAAGRNAQPPLRTDLSRNQHGRAGARRRRLRYRSPFRCPRKFVEFGGSSGDLRGARPSRSSIATASSRLPADQRAKRPAQVRQIGRPAARARVGSSVSRPRKASARSR